MAQSLPSQAQVPATVSNRSLDFDAAAELVDWYRARWEIELFFLVWKQGCRVEVLQLPTLERLEKALVLFMIVAWRVARLMRLGRTTPELDAALLFSPEEWQAAYLLAKKRPPKQAPTLNTVIQLIAGLLDRVLEGTQRLLPADQGALLRLDSGPSRQPRGAVQRL